MSEMSLLPETLFEKSKKSKMSEMSLMPETLFEKIKFSLVSEMKNQRPFKSAVVAMVPRVKITDLQCL